MDCRLSPTKTGGTANTMVMLGCSQPTTRNWTTKGRLIALYRSLILVPCGPQKSLFSLDSIEWKRIYMRSCFVSHTQIKSSRHDAKAIFDSDTKPSDGMWLAGAECDSCKHCFVWKSIQGGDQEALATCNNSASSPNSAAASDGFR